MRNVFTPANRARVARIRRLSDESGLALLDTLEPRLVLAINPSAEEQYMLELLNRFRTDPHGELARLTNSLSGEARSSDPDINSALDFFNVNGPVLQSQWSALTAVPPLAQNEALYRMAELQSENMILDDMQEHNLPGRPGLAERADMFDYDYSILGENIFAYAESVFHGHGAFAIDWGAGPNGIQNPPGHRQSMLSSQFREIGIRILPETAQATEVGPLVITQNFGTRQSFGDAWLVGVVFDDQNTNEFYTVGEGLGGVTVTAVSGSGTFITTTFDAGGYQMQLPADTYTVTFSGGAFGSPLVVQDVIIGVTNAKLDAIAGQAPPTPIIRVLGNDTAITAGDSTPDSADHTAFGSVDVTTGAITRTFTVRNDGTGVLAISGGPRVVIADDAGDAFTLTMDLAAAAIEPGAQLTFTVTFDPATVGDHTATVTINSDDATFPEFRFTISGAGVSVPVIGVEGRGVAILDGSTEISGANATYFGKANASGQTTNRVYTIFNNGSAPLTITNVRINGKNRGAFTIAAMPASNVLGPGESTTFTVQFDPPNRGQKNARIIIRSDDPATAKYAFSVRGKAFVTPVISVRGNSKIIANDDNTPGKPDNTHFGRVNVVQKKRNKEFVVRNTGPGMLRLTAGSRVKITGAHAQDFTIIRRPDEFVPRNTSTRFTVQFNPSRVGVRNAWLVIKTNDPDTPTFRFKITGRGFRTT